MTGEYKNNVLDKTTVRGFVEWRRRNRIKTTIALRKLAELVDAVKKVDKDSTKVGAEFNPEGNCVDPDINKLD